MHWRGLLNFFPLFERFAMKLWYFRYRIILVGQIIYCFSLRKKEAHYSLGFWTSYSFFFFTFTIMAIILLAPLLVATQPDSDNTKCAIIVSWIAITSIQSGWTDDHKCSRPKPLPTLCSCKLKSLFCFVVFFTHTTDPW